MTRLLYLEDQYMRECTSRVKRVEGQLVFLEATVFYPGGGGQPCDRGRLYFDSLECQVLEARKEGDDIAHRVEGPLPQEGKEVRASIDWDLRYAHMRHHTALHILSAAVFKLYGSLVTGGQIYHDRARVDFDLDELSQERVRRIEEEANRVVMEARPVTARIIPRDEAMKIPDLIRTKVNLLPPSIQQIRVVEIEGYDQQADGGTHVANTREVGYIKVARTENKGRMRRRMEIVLRPLEY